jgi:hypothetical protein
LRMILSSNSFTGEFSQISTWKLWFSNYTKDF